MSDKIFVRAPKLGDYVCKRVSDRKVRFLDWENPDCPEGNLFSVEGEQYEKIGSAVPYRGKVLCLWRETATRTWCDRYEWVLSGYTLDGAEHTGTLSIRTAANWSTLVDYDFTYASTTKRELVEQLNAFFASTEVFDGEHQDWYAERADLGDGEAEVRVSCAFVNNTMVYNQGKNGFKLTGSAMPEIPTVYSSIRSSNDNSAFGGAIGNFPRALIFYRSDSSTYNPTEDVISVKRKTPICLPAYLGESAYQSDHCAFLRSVYGEGEQGWLRFMESFLPIENDSYGAMGVDGKSISKICAAATYTSQAKTYEPKYKAARYCHDVESDTVSKGEFWLPSVAEMHSVIKGVKYPIPTNSRTADPLNASRSKAGWVAIFNNNTFWTSVRFDYRSAWIYPSNTATLTNNTADTTNIAIPVSLYPCGGNL